MATRRACKAASAIAQFRPARWERKESERIKTRKTGLHRRQFIYLHARICVPIPHFTHHTRSRDEHPNHRDAPVARRPSIFSIAHPRLTATNVRLRRIRLVVVHTQRTQQPFGQRRIDAVRQRRFRLIADPDCQRAWSTHNGSAAASATRRWPPPHRYDGVVSNGRGDGTPGCWPPDAAAAWVRGCVDVEQEASVAGGGVEWAGAAHSVLPSELEQRIGRSARHKGAEQRTVLLGDFGDKTHFWDKVNSPRAIAEINLTHIHIFDSLNMHI